MCLYLTGVPGVEFAVKEGVEQDSDSAQVMLTVLPRQSMLGGAWTAHALISTSPCQ